MVSGCNPTYAARRDLDSSPPTFFGAGRPKQGKLWSIRRGKQSRHLQPRTSGTPLQPNAGEIKTHARSRGEKVMSKGTDAKKETKKKPTKTPKEKKAEKKSKKDAKGSLT